MSQSTDDTASAPDGWPCGWPAARAARRSALGGTLPRCSEVTSRRELEEGRPAGVIPCTCWRDGRERQTSPLSKPLGKTAAGEAAVPRSPSRSSRARAKEATAEGVVRALGEGGVRHRGGACERTRRGRRLRRRRPLRGPDIRLRRGGRLPEALWRYMYDVSWVRLRPRQPI